MRISETKTLKDQVAVVTGASIGIGSAIASALAEREASLCLLGRDHRKLDAVAAKILAPLQLIHCRSTDLTKDSEIGELARFVTDQFGRLDILVHCAGAIDHGKLETAPVASLDRQYTANVRGPLMLTQLPLPLLMKPRGQVVFINSSVGLTGRANTGHFSATHTLSRRSLTLSERKSTARAFVFFERVPGANSDAPTNRSLMPVKRDLVNLNCCSSRKMSQV